MRNTLAALVVLIAAAFLATDASAAGMQPAGGPASEEIAPVDPVAVLEACRHRRIGPRRGAANVLSRRCREAELQAEGAARISDADGGAAFGCAPYLAQRGHRRVLMPLRHCRPLFA